MEMKLTSAMKPLAILATMVVVLAGMKAVAFLVGPFVLALLPAFLQVYYPLR